MNRLLWSLLISIFVSCTVEAQQIYECPALGFKFVMDNDCPYLKYSPEQLSKYEQHTVPTITYIQKKGPLDGHDLGLYLRIFKINDDTTFDRSPEAILTLLNQNGDQPVQLLLGFTNIHNVVWEFTFQPGKAVTFPKPKYSPLNNGVNLLGTIFSKSTYSERMDVIYENGDHWYGNVVNTLYPDYNDTGGSYKYFAKGLEEKLESNQHFIDSATVAIAFARKKAKADSITYITALHRQISEDSLRDQMTYRELIASLDPANYQDGWICGVGIDVEERSGEFYVTKVLKYSPAWMAGIQTDDIITYINDNTTYGNHLFYVRMMLLGNINSQISVRVKRPSLYNKEFTLLFNRLFVYNLTSEKSTGACLSGDCENGNGIYRTGTNVFYAGHFTNGKLNGEMSEIADYPDSTITFSNFIDGKRNGSTYITNGRPKFILTEWNSIAFQSPGIQINFENDQPNGLGSIIKTWNNYYNVRYDHGVLQGRALHISDPQNYTYCDVTSDFQLIHCDNYTGTPPDQSMVPQSTASHSTPSKSTGIQPETPDELTLFQMAGEEIKRDQTYKFNWSSGKTLVMQSGSQHQTIQIPVPANRKLNVYFILCPLESDKVNMYPKEIYYQSVYASGNVPTMRDDVLSKEVEMVSIVVDNDTPYSGTVEVVIDGIPASGYNTRTIYYIYGDGDL